MLAQNNPMLSLALLLGATLIIIKKRCNDMNNDMNGLEVSVIMQLVQIAKAAGITNVDLVGVRLVRDVPTVDMGETAVRGLPEYEAPEPDVLEPSYTLYLLPQTDAAPSAAQEKLMNLLHDALTSDYDAYFRLL